MTNAKAKGARNERRSRALLEAAGYTVIKSGGSLGLWDLVGLGSKDVVLVQCKTRDWPSRAEVEELQAFTCGAFARKLIHRWRDGQSVPDVRELE